MLTFQAYVVHWSGHVCNFLKRKIIFKKKKKMFYALRIKNTEEQYLDPGVHNSFIWFLLSRLVKTTCIRRIKLIFFSSSKPNWNRRPSYLQHRKRRTLRRSRSLELRQPVPSLPRVSPNFVEKSLHVAVNQVAGCQRMTLCGGIIAQAVLLGQRCVVSTGARHVGTHHAPVWAKHLPLPLVGTLGRFARQVLSCHYNGTTTGGTAIHFGHDE